MKVKLTAPAERDLTEIADWIAQDDRGLAARFISELESVCETLSAHPRRYPVYGRQPGLQSGSSCTVAI